MTNTQVRAAVSRVEWADTAKGLIILVIVLSHAALFVEGAGYPQAGLRNAIGVLTPIGMPLFFLVSGMFSRSQIDSSWRIFWDRRLKKILWVLLIWIPIDWALFAAYPNFHDPEHGRHWWQLLTAFLFPSSYLWFIWSLAAYALFAKLAGRRHPLPWAMLSGVAAVAMLGITTWHFEHYGLYLLARDYYLRGAISHLFYFYCGYAYQPLVLRTSRLPRVSTMAASLCLYLALAWTSQLATGVLTGGLIRFVAVATGIMAAIFVGKTLALWRSTGRVFASLGQLTLPIYLTHLLFIVPLAAWLGSMKLDALRDLGAVLPLGVSFAAMLGSLSITFLAPRAGLVFLFTPPFTRAEATRGPTAGQNAIAP